MVAKIAETNFSHNWYLQGLLCKLYWWTIHWSWWKPIERSSWTKNCQRTWAVNKEDCFDLLLVKMEVWDQGEKSHTALWTMNLKTKIKSAAFQSSNLTSLSSISTTREGSWGSEDSTSTTKSRSRALLEIFNFCRSYSWQIACLILSGAKNMSNFSLDPPTSGNLCEQPLFATFRARWVQSGLDWSLKQSSTSKAPPGQDSSEREKNSSPMFRTREIRSSV